MADKGPYVSPDRDELYYPLEHWTYNRARADAAVMAREHFDDWGRSRYTGRINAQLHDHEGSEEGECPDQPCAWVKAWSFDMYERG